MNIEFENTEQVIKAIEKIGDADAFKQILGKACALVERSAKQKAPKDTGELARSITSEIRITDDEIQGVVFTPLMYAPYVEYGTGLFAEEGGRTDVPWNYQDDEGNWHSTSGQHPQPFMRPALEENREEIARMLKEGIGND